MSGSRLKIVNTVLPHWRGNNRKNAFDLVISELFPGHFGDGETFYSTILIMLYAPLSSELAQFAHRPIRPYELAQQILQLVIRGLRKQNR